MYVLIEGIDLAGKSTICRRFAEQSRFEWSIQSNSLTRDNPVYQLADRLRKQIAFSAETLGNLYYAGLLADLELFKEPPNNTIQDSTIILRSLAYHTVNKTPRLPELFKSLLDRHPKFDHAFVCSATLEVRLERLKIRRKENLGPEDFLVRDDPEKFLAMEGCLIEYAQRAFHAQVIDTSNLEKGLGLEPLLDLIG